MENKPIVLHASKLYLYPLGLIFLSMVMCGVYCGVIEDVWANPPFTIEDFWTIIAFFIVLIMGILFIIGPTIFRATFTEEGMRIVYNKKIMLWTNIGKVEDVPWKKIKKVEYWDTNIFAGGYHIFYESSKGRDARLILPWLVRNKKKAMKLVVKYVDKRKIDPLVFQKVNA